MPIVNGHSADAEPPSNGVVSMNGGAESGATVAASAERWQESSSAEGIPLNGNASDTSAKKRQLNAKNGNSNEPQGSSSRDLQVV